MTTQKEHFIQSFEIKKFYDIQNTGTKISNGFL
jgi:hypothetical protein